MENMGQKDLPCVRTFNNVLARNHLISKEASLAAKHTVRPHSALDLAVPASVYTESPRKLPERISDWDYGADCKLCKVRQNGYFSFEGQGYFLSEAFRGKTIAVRESHLPGQITLLFRQFRVGRIDREKRVFTMRRIYRLTGDPRENV